jgi:hypothetical protein
LTALPEFNLFGERTPPPPPPKTSFVPVYEAFARGGGKLDNFTRQVLGRQARKLIASDGYPIAQVAQAAGEMGRNGTAAAYLGRTVRDMPEPCVNGSARARLTQGQLRRCPCAKCTEWAKLREGQPLEL